MTICARSRYVIYTWQLCMSNNLYARKIPRPASPSHDGIYLLITEAGICAPHRHQFEAKSRTIHMVWSMITSSVKPSTSSAWSIYGLRYYGVLWFLFAVCYHMMIHNAQSDDSDQSNGVDRRAFLFLVISQDITRISSLLRWLIMTSGSIIN